jgi:N-acetylglucosamine kinase-like BadF-type ATPase
VSLFLGVDGGGTKTALCLLTEDGTLASSVTVRSCYYLRQEVGGVSGPALVADVLTEGVAAVCAAGNIAPDDITFAFLGLPGYGEVSADLAALDAAPAAALGHNRYRCDNDMVAGWAGSLGGVDGINVVAGTGSIAYGQWEGVHARAGGWGEIFGDEGSGYWIGMRGLQAFSQMSDGRLAAGALLGLLREHLDLSGDLELIDVVLTRWRGDRRQVAALSRVVVEAGTRDDEVAAGILAEAGTELARLAEATWRRIAPRPDDGRDPGPGQVPVSFSGGVFTVETVRTAFTGHLAARGLFTVRPPLFPPDVGAALHAARLAGTPLKRQALERLCRARAA